MPTEWSEAEKAMVEFWGTLTICVWLLVAVICIYIKVM